MAYIIQGGVSSQAWRQNSLQFNVMIRIAGADLQIQDLDIDFDIIKTNKSSTNKSTITIWNLNDTTYQRIVEKVYAVDLYVWYGDDEPSLIFRGYVDNNSTIKRNSVQGARGFIQNSVKQDVRGSFDIPTVIELVDGKIAYTSTVINKNYRQKVTSTQIIKDCIEAMNVGIARFSDNLPERTYNTFKAVGKPHVILRQVCNSLGIKFFVINDLIQIVASEEKNNDEYAVLLDSTNSMRPDKRGDNELAISTRLIPFINPNDWVKCEFKEFDGVEQVREVHHKGNNYGTEGSTEIILGFDKPKKPKKVRKKRKRKTKKKDAGL